MVNKSLDMGHCEPAFPAKQSPPWREGDCRIPLRSIRNDILFKVLLTITVLRILKRIESIYPRLYGISEHTFLKPAG